MDLDPKILRILYSSRDFQLSLSSLDFLLEIDENENCNCIELRRYRCYLETAINSYCRPFTKSFGMPLLKFEDILLEPTEEELILHKEILKYRNQVSAHSDVNKIRVLLKTTPIKIGETTAYYPEIVTDEGLEFLDKRHALESWIRTLKFKTYQYIFDYAQTHKEAFKIHKDFKNPLASD